MGDPHERTEGTVRTPPRSQGVHHTGGLCDSSGFLGTLDRGVLVAIVGRFRHV